MGFLKSMLKPPLKPNQILDQWIEINIPFYVFDSENCFCNKGLNKPGTLIEVNNNIYLIGHINENRGLCDCCPEFENDAIVSRYKIIWKEK